jgi:hypothetical protein
MLKNVLFIQIPILMIKGVKGLSENVLFISEIRTPQPAAENMKTKRT